MKDIVNKIMYIMNDIDYGFKDENGNNIIDVDINKWNEEFNSFYYLQTPEELLKTKCGVCWDQVELERYLFKKNDINIKTYFIFISDDNMLPSHTFLVYEDNGKCYWFEHSWQKYRGVHEYNNEFDLLLDVASKFKNDHLEVSGSDSLYLYEYEKPIKHIGCNDFYKYIETQKIIELN